MMSRFKREQRAILDLVIRLSWGCGQKVAYIPKQRDFCIAGVYESHVKKELRWLEKANVLWIDWENHLFAVNKDYESWRVSIVDDYNDDRLEELIALNLQMSKPLHISKHLQISKLELTNKEDGQAVNTDAERVLGASKDIIKDTTTTPPIVPPLNAQAAQDSEGSLPGGEAGTGDDAPAAHGGQGNVPESITAEERRMLATLRGVKGYRFDFATDLAYLRTLMLDFPDVDVANEVTKWATNKLDKPLKPTSNPRLQLRNWMEKAREFAQRGGQGYGRQRQISRARGGVSQGPDPSSKYAKVYR